MYCSNCRAQIQGGATFCPKCGKPLVVTPPVIYITPQAPPKKKRRWLFILAGAIVFLIVLVSFFGDDEPVNVENVFMGTPYDFMSERYEPNDTWAVYWYLCGSDLETEGGFASNDLAEMMEVQLPANVSVVIETGGSKKWHNGVEADSNSRYLYNSGGLQFSEKTPRANMSDKKTLEAFLRFCNRNYPADHKIVILWDHGGGSVAGVIWDEWFGDDSLKLPDIRSAFEAVTPASKENPHYEMIGFDACLMATIDVADTFSGLGKWLVASQELEPALGWNYTGFLQALADDTGMNGAMLGKAICDTYYAACKKEGLADDITLSVVDLRRADALMSAYHNVGVESLVYACVNTSYFSDFGRAAKKAQSYGPNSFWSGYTNMVDLGDLVYQSGDTLLPEYGRALIDALNSSVVYQVKGSLRSRASGLACYYSFDGDYDNFKGFASLRGSDPFRWFYDYALTGELSAEGKRYVQSLANTYKPAKNITPKAMKSTKNDNLEGFPVRTTDDSVAILELGTEIADKLTGVYCQIAYYDEENDIIVLLGRDNDLDADWEKGVFMDNFRGVWGSIDGVLCYMELTDEADDYQLYTVPVLLNGEEYSLSVSYTYEDEEYRIIGARRGIDDNGMADKNLRKLQPGDVIEPLHYVFFDMDDEDEEPTQMTVEKLTVTVNTRFTEMDLGDGKFIFMFEMVDVQNNSYLSETVMFLIEDGKIYILDDK